MISLQIGQSLWGGFIEDVASSTGGGAMTVVDQQPRLAAKSVSGSDLAQLCLALIC